MRYIPIARRYRPKTFSEIVGQEGIVKTLQNQLKTGRIPHAFLFSGTRGVGKTTTARILAKALNCEKGITPEPCNQCNYCRAIDEGNSLFLMEIDGASNRGIDEVRSLQEAIVQRPLEGRFKVVIIDEVHMLTQEAFNALLKTIEEPPEHVVFVFATTDYQRVPATILSRTVHFHFREIPAEIIKEQIKKIVEKEGLEIEEKAAILISEAAEGSMRDAETSLEKVIAYSEGKITIKDVEKALGLVPSALMEELTRAIEKRDREKIFKIVEEIFIQGYNVRRFLKDYVGFLRSVLYEKIKGNRNRFPGLSREDLIRFSNLILEGEYRIKNATNPRVYLELMLLKISFLQNVVDLEDVIDRMIKGNIPEIKMSEKSGTGKTVEEKKTDVSFEKEEVQQPTSENHSAEWTEVVKLAERRSNILSTALEEAHSVKIDKNTIIIKYKGTEGEYYKEKVESLMNVLKEVTKEIFSREMDIKTVYIEEKKGIKEPENEREENPKILMFRRIFKAKEIKEE